MTHIETVIAEFRAAEIPMSDALGKALDGLRAESERLTRLLSHATSENPGTSTLVMLMNENERMRQALRFYAHRYHLTLSNPFAWDAVSGEPPNYLCDDAGTATIEDGTIACMALRGVDLGDEIEELRMPIEGEPNALPVSGAPD